MAEALDSSLPPTPRRSVSGPADGDAPRAAAVLPSEPFACPNCGQMLGPGCRVCAVCKEPVDPTRIKTLPARLVAASDHLPPPRSVVPTAPFPWGIFLIVLGLTWFAAGASLRFLGLEKMQMLFAGVQLVSAAWVLYDARQKGIPRSWRWALSSLLVWLIIFPWYLGRRRRPSATCPFMESNAFFRAVVLLALVLFVIALVLAYKNVPLPK